MRPCTCGGNEAEGHIEDCGSLTTVEEDYALEAVDEATSRLAGLRAAIENMCDPRISKTKASYRKSRLTNSYIRPLQDAVQDIKDIMDREFQS